MTSKAQPATNVRAYVLAGYRFAGAELGMESAAKAAAKVFGASIRAAIDNKDADTLRAIRHDFQIGDFMRRLVKAGALTANPDLADDFTDAMWDRARAMFYAQSFNSKAEKTGMPRRTKTQETAFEAARKAWGRMMSVTGLRSLETRGGARAKPQAEAAKPEAAKPEAAKPEAGVVSEPIAPVTRSVEDLRKLLREQGAAMALTLSRASVNGGVKVPEELTALVKQFRDGIDAAIKAASMNK